MSVKAEFKDCVDVMTQVCAFNILDFELRRAKPSIAPVKVAEIVAQLAHTEGQGSWHPLVEYQELSDLARPSAGSIGHAKPSARRNRPQDCFPLHIVQ